MKKALFTALATLMLSVGTVYSMGYWGDFRIPTDKSGVKAQSLANCGVSPFNIAYTSQPTLLAGSVLVYGALTSTIPYNASIVSNLVQLEIRSTNTANVTSELLVPPIVFSSASMNTLIVFDPPIVAHDGISVNITTHATAMATVFYRYLSTNTLEEFYIPYDKDGAKAFSPSFYGAYVSSGSGAGNGENDNLDYSSSELTVMRTTSGTYLLTNKEPGLFQTIIVGSAPATALGSFVVLRDTVSIGGTSNSDLFLPPIFYNNWNIEDVLYNAGALSFSAGRTKTISLPFPVIFENGLTQKRSVATDRFRIPVRPLNKLR